MMCSISFSSDFVQKHSVKSKFFLSALGVEFVVCWLFNINHVETGFKVGAM